MIKIGAFSKLVQVPVATLRYYDQVGLLKPMLVDRATGYRSYSAGQVPRLQRILALRGLGFSLQQIAALLSDGVTPEQLRGMLRVRHAQLQQQLADVQRQLVEVDTRLQQLERAEDGSNYDVTLKHVDPLLVASVRTILPDHSVIGTLFSEVYRELDSYAGTALEPGAELGGKTLALWYDAEFKEHDVDGAAAFMLRRVVPERGRMRMHHLPAATMAATIHHGSYQTIGDAHVAILQWIETHGYRIAGPDRELYLYHTPPIRRDNPTYITELQYPIEKE